jgi:hypothetical protein
MRFRRQRTEPYELRKNHPAAFLSEEGGAQRRKECHPTARSAASRLSSVLCPLKRSKAK